MKYKTMYLLVVETALVAGFGWNQKLLMSKTFVVLNEKRQGHHSHVAMP